MLDFIKHVVKAIRVRLIAAPLWVRLMVLLLAMPAAAGAVGAVVVVLITITVCSVAVKTVGTVFGGMLAPGTIYAINGPSGEKGYLMGTWHNYLPTPWRAVWLLLKVGGRLAVEVSTSDILKWRKAGGQLMAINDVDLRDDVRRASETQDKALYLLMAWLPGSIVGVEYVLEAFATTAWSLEDPVMQASMALHTAGVRNADAYHYRMPRLKYLVGIVKELVGTHMGWEYTTVNNAAYLADKDVSAEFTLRNGIQARSIITFLQKGEGLCVVGVSHLRGEGSVLQCLTSQGWEVKKI